MKRTLHAEIPLLFMSAHAQFGLTEVKDMLWKLLHEE